MRIVLLAGAATPDALIEALRAAGHTVERGDGKAYRATPAEGRLLVEQSALPEVAGALSSHHDAVLIRDPTEGLAGLLPGSVRIIATSAATAEWLQTACGVAPERVTTIVPGVPAAVRSRGSLRGCGILAFESEGTPLLLAALARLFDLDWSLTVIGSDGRHAALATTLEITGRVREIADPAMIEAAWQAADLLVWPAPWRGETPAPISEALRRGMPVIATVHGSEAAAVPEQSGLACPPGDRDQLSRALRRLIFDPALRNAYADAAYAAGAYLPDWAEHARRVAEVLT